MKRCHFCLGYFARPFSFDRNRIMFGHHQIKMTKVYFFPNSNQKVNLITSNGEYRIDQIILLKSIISMSEAFFSRREIFLFSQVQILFNRTFWHVHDYSRIRIIMIDFQKIQLFVFLYN